MSANAPQSTPPHNADAKAPQALIVSHGQPSDPDPAEAALAERAAKVQALLPDTLITSATLAAPGSLEKALAMLPSGAFVYPMFMADGWFVKVALAKRLKGHDLQVLAPFGLDANLPALAAQALLRAVKDADWPTDKTKILLAAHGYAHGNAAADSAYLFAGRLARALAGMEVTVGFIEQEPYLAAVAEPLEQPSLCLPFFAMKGEHVRDDIPEALLKAGFSGPVLPALSQCEGATDLIARTLRTALRERNAV